MTWAFHWDPMGVQLRLPGSNVNLVHARGYPTGEDVRVAGRSCHVACTCPKPVVVRRRLVRS